MATGLNLRIFDGHQQLPDDIVISLNFSGFLRLARANQDILDGRRSAFEVGQPNRQPAQVPSQTSTQPIPGRIQHPGNYPSSASYEAPFHPAGYAGPDPMTMNTPSLSMRDSNGYLANPSRSGNGVPEEDVTTSLHSYQQTVSQSLLDSLQDPNQNRFTNFVSSF